MQRGHPITIRPWNSMGAATCWQHGVLTEGQTVDSGGGRSPWRNPRQKYAVSFNQRSRKSRLASSSGSWCLRQACRRWWQPIWSGWCRQYIFYVRSCCTSLGPALTGAVPCTLWHSSARWSASFLWSSILPKPVVILYQWFISPDYLIDRAIHRSKTRTIQLKNTKVRTRDYGI